MNFPEPTNLRVVRVREAGQARERVLIRARRACNLGKYAIVGVTIDGNGYFPTNRQIYWFPDAEVEAGDLIVLQTLDGIDGAFPNAEGKTTHRFHWALTKPVWTSLRVPCLVLIGAADFADEVT